ncbi:MAG: ribonuclease III [Candidatus Cloacimonadaceae bacterium]|jgi:ribonuclease-3|nr:ribonuclease III [Candidatus Cloacimonadota bacterium]MCB5257696.1 ribonuclease III [Candidatus Cloacimonadota bacterium]MDD5625017.1 ribonuclease III [Candidatus Cloacimonadota bacterium]MDY0111761.1 ribonuclease III [Candidatus Syntrophosphaera sp.]
MKKVRKKQSVNKLFKRFIEFINGKGIQEQYPKWEKSLKQLQKKINYNFHDINLLKAALTHKSYLNRNGSESQTSSSFERMEFLGDAILGFGVSRELFNRNPNEQEGKLSKLKSKIVSETYLTLKANALDLGKYLLLSQEEQQSGGAKKPSIVSDAMEALICAIYLDSGISAAMRFIKNNIMNDYENVVNRNELVNYKSILQEYMQSRNQPPPVYITVAEEGPEHNKTFIVEARLGNEVLGKGKGSTKKGAQQEAACDACQRLGI